MQALFPAQQGCGGGGQAQGTEVVEVGFEQAACDQLPENAAPLLRVVFAADAESTQRLVAELAHLGGVGTAQYVDQVRGAEALAAAVDTGQRLACGIGGVPGLWWVQAVVAVAAIAGMGLAEIGQQGLPAAGGGFAIADQGIELGVFQPLAFRARLPFFDHPPQLHGIAQSIRQPGFGGLAVAAGAAGFLVVAFQ